mmetsp:Transcript_15262/g.37474  ORF Transcript_15262/g.37474 Transcript_15262/m.37474 type:complete len:81 (-) Transcript_15262:1107-1349(-)
MGKGRPPGSKNKTGHSAGGDRKSKKYKDKKQAERARGQRHIAELFNARRQPKEPPAYIRHPLSKQRKNRGYKRSRSPLTN